ncbi:MAG: S8 family peptidase [Melioribacteraceae bacterium]|nr:S8 family peptidase [Melioribacteraceae bacterium]
MKQLFLILIFITSSLTFAQTKYLIYFKDKGISSTERLEKTSTLYKISEESLSKRTIERRKKIMGESYITLKDVPLSKNYIEQIKSVGIKVKNKLKWFNAVSAYLTEEQKSKIKNFNFVDRIKLVKSFHRKPIINFEKKEQTLVKKNSQNNLYNYGSSLTQYLLSDVPTVHNAGFNGEDVTIGLLDTGFDWKNHPALSNRNVIAEKDFVFDDDNTADEDEDDPGQDSHGTSVFSVIGGFEEGSLIGPAFNAKYILAKTEYTPTETRVEEDNYAAALEWMEALGADIVSSSVGYNEFDSDTESYSYEDLDGKTTIVTKASELAFNRGVLTITSAGNEGNNNWKYITAPGDGFNTLTIGAVTEDNELSYFSSLGPTADGRIKPELTAMGTKIYMAQNSKVSQYKYANGTSFSAPIASGVAAQLLSAHPYLTNEQMRAILIESGDNANKPNNEIGYGLISALKAVEYPNINTTDGSFQINKLFIADTVQESTVNVHLLGENDELESHLMSKQNDSRYTFDMSDFSGNKIIKVYFTYQRVGENTEKRYPTDNQYLKYENDSPTLNLNFTPDTITIEPPEPVVKEYKLEQNYPNPFNIGTTIRYKLEKDSHVNLTVYNILGEKVTTLVDATKNAGVLYSVNFRINNLSSGFYIYRLETDGFTESRKMILIK